MAVLNGFTISMIEPLRYCKETALTHEIERCVFCTQCLIRKQTRQNPNLAIVFCSKCTFTIDDHTEYGAYLCKSCNEETHKYGLNVDHIRQTLVVGPGVRKRVAVRGDGVSFPLPLDQVTIRMKARVYQNGKRVHDEKKKIMSFMAGLSGKCIHVQVLGARQLGGADVNGQSDPFVVYSYCSKPVSSTRVKPQTKNPSWLNETFVVPVEEHMAYPRNMVSAQRDLIKFEVFDYDWTSSNDFLGQIEMTRSKLMKLAAVANEQPISLPLTSKKCHGAISVQFACDHSFLHVRIVNAEDLDKQDMFQYANPYAKVFLGENALVGTTSVVQNSIHPIWTSPNEFKIKLAELLEAEKLLDSQVRMHRASAGLATSPNRINRRIVSEVPTDHVYRDDYSTMPDTLALIRVEVYNRRPWRGDTLLGKAAIFSEQLRRVLPDLSSYNELVMAEHNENVAAPRFESTARSLSRSVSRYFVRDFPFNDNSDESGQGVLSKYYSRLMACFQKKVETDAAESFDLEHLRSVDHPRIGRSAMYSRLERYAEHSRVDHSSASASGSGIVPLSPPPNSRSVSGIPNVKGLTRMLSRRNQCELSFTPLQRYPLMKHSIKTHIESQGIDTNDAECGFLILRLLISNHGKVVVGLDEGVRRMTIGETAFIKCRYDMIYGNYCLGSTLPPRANVVFQVSLLEINGRGRLGLLERMLRRFWRGFLAVCGIIMRFLKPLYDKFKAFEDGRKVVDGKMARRSRSSRKWSVFSMFSAAYDSGQDEDYMGDFSDHSDEDADAFEDDDEDDGGDEEEGDGSAKHGLAGGKPDPYVKKHLTRAVEAGAKIMWTHESSSLNKLAMKSQVGFGDDLTRQLRRIQELSGVEDKHHSELEATVQPKAAPLPRLEDRGRLSHVTSADHKPGQEERVQEGDDEEESEEEEDDDGDNDDNDQEEGEEDDENGSYS
jgi:hypothetical protein